MTGESPAAVKWTRLAKGDESRWDDFAGRVPGATLYHRAGWASVIQEAFGQEPIYLIAESKGRIEGVLPLFAFSHFVFGKYLVSMPFLNRGGILAETDRARHALLEGAKTLLRETGSAYCELRHTEAEAIGGLPARTAKVSMALTLDADPELLWKRVGPKVRNLVRKAERAGLEVREGQGEEDLATFQELFAVNMRDLGTPVYSPGFFRAVLGAFGDHCRLTLVERDGVAAAGGLCLQYNGFTEIHWAASRREFRRDSPNMLLYWDAIRDACETGLRTFCFGRSTEGSGPYRFKRQWGAEPVPLRWEYLLSAGGGLPELNPDNPRFRLAVRIWQRLPLSVTRILGPPIVRHLP
ncbi:MAG: FemAB family PEP-CTERM system-associated protein [Gemmatimonadota bacterium]|jgi:FemAB-related protein (PEP-CTERM system-associated)|nr:FemAB family PEP-CTERM system-associated protein [Gemmatimonadota bacterium]